MKLMARYLKRFFEKNCSQKFCHRKILIFLKFNKGSSDKKFGAKVKKEMQ